MVIALALASIATIVLSVFAHPTYVEQRFRRFLATVPGCKVIESRCLGKTSDRILLVPIIQSRLTN